MEKNKLNWCLKQKRGISLIDINKNLSNSYLKRAEEDLLMLEKQNKVWRVIFSYYILYNSFTSILYRYGIKSEIHSCSVELISLFDNLKSYKDFFKDLKESREDVQYYLTEPEEIDLNKIKVFLQLVKIELNEINTNKINNILKNFK